MVGLLVEVTGALPASLEMFHPKDRSRLELEAIPYNFLGAEMATLLQEIVEAEFMEKQQLEQ